MSDFEFDELDELLATSGSADARDQAIDRFEAEVKRRMKLLLTKSEDPEERREAAYWLGDSGSPRAITALRKIYRGEKDKKIKAAAEYALGQFKALDLAIERGPGESVMEALGRPENAYVAQLLEDIVLKGKQGRRGGGAGRRFLLIANIVLLIGFIGLLAAIVTDGIHINLNFGGGGGGDDLDLTFDDPVLLALATLDQLAEDTLNDATELRSRFQSVQNGRALDCDQNDLARPQPYTPPTEVTLSNPLVSVFNNQLSEQRARVAQALEYFDASCAQGQPIPADLLNGFVMDLGGDQGVQPIVTELRGRISAEETRVTTILAATVTVLAETAAASTALATQSARDDATEESTPAAATQGPTETPTPEPSPTFDTQLIRNEARVLARLIDDMEAERGPLTLLRQYYTDLNVSGSTAGCLQAAPIVPEDYPLPPEVGLAAPELADAAQRINIGLGLLRAGWQAFQQGCATQNFNSSAGLQVAANVQTTFADARVILGQFLGPG